MTAPSRRAFLTRSATLGSGMLLARHFGWPPAVERLLWADAQQDGRARRTHQDGVPHLAKDFQPAVMDHAAMPVRVEQWRVDTQILYRVVGILWGGDRPTGALSIRFNAAEEATAGDSFLWTRNSTWTLWTHTWRPRRPGSYTITLHVDDRQIRTRRLDQGYYARTVEVSRV